MWLLLAALVHAVAPVPSPPLDYPTWAAGEPVVTHPEPAYHYAAELHREIAPLVATRPGVVRPFVIGRTVNDRPIWAFRVSRPGDVPPPGLPRKKLLVFAQIHALEWVPSEIALAFLTEIAKSPPMGVEITVVPSLNPDGRAKVEADLLVGENKYRRGNANNVDLNRDFPVNREAKAIWRHLIPGRYATSPSPLSQPESRALDALAAEERFDVAVSLHSFGGFLYYPWAGLWERPADWAEMHRMAVVMQAAMGAHAYKPRQLARWGFFFRGHGMEIDHLYGSYGTRSFLIETTRSGFSLLRPQEWGNHFRWYNPKEPERHVREGLHALRALAHDIGRR